MGTNYYLRGKACAHCGRGDEDKYIGKSSGGWHFTLHVEPENGINTLDDWKALFAKPETKIVDEYERELSVEQMIKVITDRSWDRPNDWSKEEYEQNHAEPGLKGLARHKIDGHCIANGKGTWDCVVGDFS